MKGISLFPLLSSLFIFFWGCNDSSETPVTPKPILKVSKVVECGSSASLTPDMKVCNSYWGSSTTEEYIEQKISIYDPSEEPLCGWSWDWGSLRDTVVLGFPHILFGESIEKGGQSVTTAKLPALIKELDSLSVIYSFRDSMEGENLMSFWLWIKDRKSGLITDKFVISIPNGITPPPRAVGPKVEVDSVTEKYSDSTALYNVVRVALHFMTNRDTLNIKEWLDYSIDQKVIRNIDNKEITTVQFGTEIANGGGVVDILQYDLAVVTTPLPEKIEVSKVIALGAYGELTPNMRVHNNYWGTSENLLEQNISLYKESSVAPLCSWNWDWKQLKSSNVLGFPNIQFGKDPWESNGSTTNKLPALLKCIDSLSVEYAFRDSSHGGSCMSFCLWITDERVGGYKKIRDEIVIRLNNKFISNSGSLIIPQKEVDGMVGEIYRDTLDGYNAITINLTKEFTEGQINLKKWIDYLIEQDIITNIDIKSLAEVQLGTEIANGSGVVDIMQYEVHCVTTPISESYLTCSEGE